MRSSENLNLGVLEEPAAPDAWGKEGPEDIVQLLWMAAGSREVGRCGRVVYKEKERDMNEREKA